MAYYDALTAAWNSGTQPPAAVTGTALTGGMTTQQKINAVNGWTTAGAAVPMIVPTYRIYNLIVPSEFGALQAANQQLVRDILSMGTVDASPGTSVRTRMVAIFPNGTTTFANLAALAATYDSPTTNWAAKNGYPVRADGTGNLNLSDAANAGLT